MRRVPARVYLFVAATCLVAAPFIAVGIQDVLNDEPPGIVAFYIWALCVLLSLRPIRIAPTVELSASEVAVLAGVVLLTPGQLALVALDLGQILALQLMLGTERLSGQTLGWINRTGRAQLLWGLAAVIAVEIILVQPWFLLPGIPLFLLGYLDIRARFIAERRARLLATLVEVGHAVGSSLDPNEVFRNVYRQVAAVMDADNFFVATLGLDGSTVRYRFLMDGGKELAPIERPRAGTLVGATIERGPLLLRDVEHDSGRLGLPELTSWGAVEEHSIIVAPLRHRDVVAAPLRAAPRRPRDRRTDRARRRHAAPRRVGRRSLEAGGLRDLPR